MCDCIDERPQAYQEKIRIARKAHCCCECGGAIKPGDRYHYASGVWDGRGDNYKTCLTCHPWREALECWAFGELVNDLRETYHQRTGDDWVAHYHADAYVDV